MIRIRLLSLALLVLGIGVVGCSGNKAAPARVSGTVTYKGEALKAGNMYFHSSDGAAYSALIGPDGTYTATDLPTGDMVVTVETETLNPAKKDDPKGGKAKKDADRRSRMMGQQKAPEGMGPTGADNYTKIPDKYAKKDSSPLKVTLERGSQTEDFELTD